MLPELLIVEKFDTSSEKQNAPQLASPTKVVPDPSCFPSPRLLRTAFHLSLSFFRKNLLSSATPFLTGRILKAVERCRYLKPFSVESFLS
jgi:hypothetical protein